MASGPFEISICRHLSCCQTLIDAWEALGVAGDVRQRFRTDEVPGRLHVGGETAGRDAEGHRDRRELRKLRAARQGGRRRCSAGGWIPTTRSRKTA